MMFHGWGLALGLGCGLVRGLGCGLALGLGWGLALGLGDGPNYAELEKNKHHHCLNLIGRFKYCLCQAQA
jgi:hypothetical protein